MGPAYLGPGSGPPPARAELTVAGPAALGPGVVAVFGVHGAGGVVVQQLYAAHGASLRARPPTALTARLPFPCDPPVGAEQQVNPPPPTPKKPARAMAAACFPPPPPPPAPGIFPFCKDVLEPGRASVRGPAGDSHPLLGGMPWLGRGGGHREPQICPFSASADITNPPGQQCGLCQHPPHAAPCARLPALFSPGGPAKGIWARRSRPPPLQ